MSANINANITATGMKHELYRDDESDDDWCIISNVNKEKEVLNSTTTQNDSGSSRNKKNPRTEKNLAMALSIDTLPDEILKAIMTFSSFGTGKFETASPASRFAHVSKKWHRLYMKAKNDGLFATNNLHRITQGMSIRTDPVVGVTGAGDVETILDCWKPMPRTLQWWTSPYVFEGGTWREGIDGGTDDGPFYLKSHAFVPTLLINFDRPVTIRGVCFWARNKPRMVHCNVESNGADKPTAEESKRSEANTLFIPRSLMKEADDFYRWARRFPSKYAKLVAQKMPQGKPANEMDCEHFDLPSILPEPLTVNVGESFRIRICATQERGWVGINSLLLFE